MKNSVLALCCLIGVLFSCNTKPKEATNDPEHIISKADENRISEIAMMAPVVQQNSSYTNSLKTDSPIHKHGIAKKIIKDGNLTVKTDDIKNSKAAIDRLVKKLTAYYEIEDLQNTDQAIAYNLKIRIPAGNFEKFIAVLENGEDKIEAKNIQARDVTEEYVDIETRLNNKRNYLKRYKELLSKALTVKDILAIEEKIRILQEEIESKEGRLNYLNDQVSFSTLSINIYQEKEDKNSSQNTFLKRTTTSFKQGWTSIVDLGIWFVGIWPYVVIVFVAFFTIRKTVKNRKNKTT